MKLPHEAVDAGGQWILAVEHLLINDARLVRAVKILQLYQQRDSKYDIILVICKRSDNFLVAGKIKCSKLFLQNIGK